MSIKTQVENTSAILASLTVISYLGSIDLQGSFWMQFGIYAPLFLLTIATLYYFYKGQNWARILLLISSVFGLLNWPALMVAETLAERVGYLMAGSVSIYLLVFLNRQEVRDYFKLHPQKGGCLRVFLGAVGVLLLLGIGIGFWLRSLIKKIEHSQIWIENIKTGEAQPITTQDLNLQPRFSHDGTRILFLSRKSADGKQGNRIVIYSLKEKTFTTVYEDKVLVNNPDWGADDESIVFLKLGSQADLWSLDLKKQTLHQITNDTAEEREARISPDGKWILFKQGSDSKPELYTMPISGGPKKQLTETKDFLHEAKFPAWMPDSQKIVYLSFLSFMLHDVSSGHAEILGAPPINNTTAIFTGPGKPERIYVKAKQDAAMNLKWDIYWLNREKLKWELIRKDRPLTEASYDVSPDQELWVYSRA